MSLRTSALAALTVASIFIHTGSALAAPLAAVASADSARALATLVASVRASEDDAWMQVEAGDPENALNTAHAALNQVERALAGTLDTSTWHELLELRSHLTRMIDSVSKDLPPEPPVEARAPATTPAVEPGNEPDEKVLNTPAVDDIPLQFNQDVYRYIEFFTGAGRSVFERWLKRSGRYMGLFRQVLQNEGLPPDLVHLVFVESGFNLNARSVSAAVGPWQFVRSSARLFGLTVNQWVDERKDPEKSTVAAARYLKHLYSIFGDWPLALASYNAGEGTVLRAIKNQGTTNYWDLKLPRQTEDYVPQFMAVLAISREPEKYGFDAVELDDPMDFDTVALKGAVELRAIARLADCSFDQLKQLNPAVRGHAAPGKDGVTTLRVPRGKGEVLLEKLHGETALPAVDLTLTHRVKRGETLQSIANQYQVNATQLARANGIGKKRPLLRGMVLTVRASFKSRMPELADASDPRASTAYVPARAFAPPATLSGQSSAEGRQTITVRRGETLASIAERYGVSTDEIMKWNHLHSAHVRRGSRLKIRTGDAAAESTAMSPSDSAQVAHLHTRAPRHRRGQHAAAARESTDLSGRHIVVHVGDTLADIAQRTGVSVGALKRANGLPSSRIRAGQHLKLPSS